MPSRVEDRVFRCSGLVRWMPRVLGGSLLAAATLVNLSLDPEAPFAGGVKGVVVLAAAVGALWIVRGGAEARVEARLEGGAVSLGARGRWSRVRVDRLEMVDYDPGLSSARRWIPAVVLVDRDGCRWRIPAFIGDGPDLMEAIVRSSGNPSVRAWAEARDVARRMVRSRGWVAAGYIVSGLLLAGAARFVYG